MKHTLYIYRAKTSCLDTYDFKWYPPPSKESYSLNSKLSHYRIVRSRWQTKHMVDFHEDNFGFYYLSGYGSKTPTLLTHRHHSVLTQLAMLLQRVVCLSCNRVPGRGRRRPIAKRDSDETFLQGAELGEHLLVSQTSERLPVQRNDLITWTTHGKRDREKCFT